MAMKKSVALSEAELLRCLALLGPPPILSSEKKEDFDEILRLSAQCVKPRNMIEVIGLWHSTCATWFTKRYVRHATVAIERVAQQTHTFHAERAKLREERKSNRERKEVEKLTQTPTDIAQVVRLENNFDTMVEDTDKIIERGTLEHNHNKSLLALLDSQEQLNRLIISQTAIKNDSYRQIELCRTGLGELASEDTDNVIEGECKEIKDPPREAEAPSIVPAEHAGSRDVEPQNCSEPAE
jgi:hypothetical protein